MTEETTTSSRSMFGTRRAFLIRGGVSLGVGAAGCSSPSPTPTERPEEATLTIRLRNRDSQQHEYEVVVNQGESVTDSFSGVLPADQQQYVEMVATFRATDEQHEFRISTAGGQRGRTWDPTERGDFFVDAFIERGEPGFPTDCRES